MPGLLQRLAKGLCRQDALQRIEPKRKALPRSHGCKCCRNIGRTRAQRPRRRKRHRLRRGRAGGRTRGGRSIEVGRHFAVAAPAVDMEPMLTSQADPAFEHWAPRNSGGINGHLVICPRLHLLRGKGMQQPTARTPATGDDTLRSAKPRPTDNIMCRSTRSWRLPQRLWGPADGHYSEHTRRLAKKSFHWQMGSVRQVCWTSHDRPIPWALMCFRPWLNGLAPQRVPLQDSERSSLSGLAPQCAPSWVRDKGGGRQSFPLSPSLRAGDPDRPGGPASASRKMMRLARGRMAENATSFAMVR